MNYYEHHIGDYDEATAHLTACEDGIYSRLIRKYMATEKALPAEIKSLQRLVRARAKDEKEAVETILEEFFELREDGWHQKRCDETIARYQDKQRKARASAEARWSGHRSQSDGNANAYPDAMRTHSEGNAIQSPITNHQTPIKDIGDPVVSGTPSRDRDDDFRPKDAAEWLSHFKRNHGFEADPTSVTDRKKLWPVFAAWTNAGLTTAFVDAAVTAAQQRAREPIACLPLYVDRLMASEQAARANPQLNAKDESRRRAYEVLTGKTAQPEPLEVINGHAKLLG